jgi:putative heme iron utilization protein
MNADHAQALHDYCRHYHRRDAGSVAMIGIDSEGFDVRADGDDPVLRLEFERPVTDAASARAALAAMAREARAA